MEIIINAIIASGIGFVGGFILGFQTRKDLIKAIDEVIKNVFKKEG